MVHILYDQQLDITWLPYIAGWIKNANVVFWEEWTEWLPDCFIVLFLLLVLSGLELSIGVSISEIDGFKTAGRFV